MPVCEMREAQEHANRVERDQGGRARIGDDHQHNRQPRQRDNSPREDQPSAAKCQLARQETIGGDQRSQAWKVRVAGIARHQQDQRRSGLQQQIEDAALSVNRAPHLRNDRFGFARQGVNLVGDQRDAQEQRDQHGAHGDQRLRRVLAARLLERA